MFLEQPLATPGLPISYNEIIIIPTFIPLSKSKGHWMNNFYATLKRNVFSEFLCKAYTRSLPVPTDPIPTITTSELGGRRQEAGGRRPP